MTENEAIKKAIRHFECMKNDAVVVLDSGFGTHPGESDSVYRNRKMYAELAINALEKQIAKKPIDKSNNPHDWHVMACPCCEHTFWNSGQFVHYQPKFCNYCGQKLDWSEEE